jgi:hypothetical protein
MNRKLFKKLGIKGLLLLVLALFLTACPKPPPPEVKVIIPATTKVPDKATRDLLSVYNPDTGIMRFTNSTSILDNLKVGDVFVGEPSSSAPNGYLRKVTKISKEGAEVILGTSQAKLTDAIHQGSLNAEGDIQPSQLRSVTPLSEGASGRALYANGLDTQAGTSNGFNFEAAIDAFIEIKGENDDAGTEVTALANFKGLVKFNVGYKILIDIGFLADLNSFDASMGYTQQTSIAVDGEVSGSVTQEKEVARFDFSPIVFFIGPVPVVVVPSAKVVIGVKGEASVSFDYTFSQNAAFEQGVHWDEDDGFKKIDRNEFKVGYEGPNFTGRAALSTYTRATMRLLFYDIFGPDIGATVGAKLDIEYPRDPLWRLFGFVKGDLAFTVDLLGEELRYNEEIFNIEKEIARGEAKPPVITVSNANPSVDLLFETDLGQFFKIDDQIGTTYTLVSDKDGAISSSTNNGANPVNKFTFKTEGSRTLTINAKSDTGKTAQAFFTVNVINSPPEQAKLETEEILTIGQGDEIDLNVLQPFDKNTGQLECNAVRWSVEGTDSLITEEGSSNGCNATAIFGTQGARRVKATITDPQGLATERTLDVTVTEPPAVFVKVKNIEVREASLAIVRGEVVSIPNPLTASIAVENTGGLALTYSWSVTTQYPEGSNPPIFTSQGIGTEPQLTINAGQALLESPAFGYRYLCAVNNGQVLLAGTNAYFRVEIFIPGRAKPRVKTFSFSCEIPGPR